MWLRCPPRVITCIRELLCLPVCLQFRKWATWISITPVFPRQCLVPREDSENINRTRKWMNDNSSRQVPSSSFTGTSIQTAQGIYVDFYKASHKWQRKDSNPGILSSQVSLQDPRDFRGMSHSVRPHLPTSHSLFPLPLLGLCDVLSHFNCVWLFANPWIITHQAPMSMGFSRQEDWGGLPYPTPFRGSSWPRDWTCVSCLLCWQAGSLSLAPPGKPS